MATKRINDEDRRQWVLNDEGLYDMRRASGRSMRAFIRSKRTAIDEVIKNVATWPMKCSKCKKPAYLAEGGGMTACQECPRSYVRCAACGGQDGARRSLKSHMGLFHPKTTEVR